MGKHLQDDTLSRQLVRVDLGAVYGHAKRADAQDTVGHVVERRERQQLFEVSLAQGEERAPENRQQRKAQQHIGVLLELVGEDWDDQAQKPVHAHLGHHAGQQDDHRCRGRGVGRGLPNVQRGQRHFHP